MERLEGQPPPLPPQVIVYCGEGWSEFWSFMDPAIVFRYLVPLVCGLGCVTNIVNVIVLTRTTMHNPTNRILTALAITDFLFVSQEIFYLILHRVLNLDVNEPIQLLDHSMDDINRLLFALLHTWTIYLTLTVAIWRWIGIVNPLKSRSWLSFSSANWAILFSLLVGTLIFIFFYLVHKIPGIDNIPVIVPLIHAILIKTIPCVALTIFNVGLVRSLLKARKQRGKLTSVLVQHSAERSGRGNSRNKNLATFLGVDRKMQKNLEQAESNRTTKMLLVILLIFLLTEFPPGIFSILEVLMDTQFYNQCQEPVVPFLNLNEYFSSTTSFFVFLIMSHGYRATLGHGLANLCSRRR